MKIWVTGARGFIGRHVVAQALGAGHQVWALIRPGTANTSAAPEGARLLAVDLGDSNAVASHAKDLAPDAIIHLAWYARPRDYVTSYENIDALALTLAFAKAVVLAGCRRFVGVGTCLEYADAPVARRESDPIAPKSLYARSKHAAHLVLSEFFEREQAALVWARLFHMHGPGEDPARLVPSVAAALRQGRPFGLSPGDQIRDHLDVRDVASALVHLAGSNLEGSVNVCSGVPITLRTVLESVGQILGRSELLHFGERPYLAGEVMNLSGFPARLVGSGFRREHADLATSLRETIAGPGTTI